MSYWGYVVLGWVVTYGVIAGWYYTSRTPANNDSNNRNDHEL